MGNKMNLIELDEYLNSFLKKENFPSDPSLNGIQIQNDAPRTKQIKRVAFAVDASEDTALAAAEKSADVLFVHHGLFWGGCQTLTGNFYRRISAFMKNNIALIAYHIPLDANTETGNNYGTAARLGLTDTKPFGTWRGMSLGVKGLLPAPMSAEELAEKALRPGRQPVSVLNFGKDLINSVGIISGGAGDDVDQAVAAGLDAFITGEFPHSQYHFAKEEKITVIAGGHYETETVGVNLVMEKLRKETGTECLFIDFPTSL